MKRNSEILALLAKAQDQLQSIRKEYQKSLQDQKISDLLKVDIKNLCENVRSVLDYLAHTIRERYCRPPGAKDKFYFPILPDPAQFKTKVGHWFPGLEAANKSLYDALESMQPYHPGNDWLGLLNQVNNENKHDKLVEQKRRQTVERVEIRSKGTGSGVSWDPRGVRFGSGVSVLGAPIDPKTQMPFAGPDHTVTKTIWVDFRFADMDVSVLELLERSVSGTQQIVADVRAAVGA